MITRLRALFVIGLLSGLAACSSSPSSDLAPLPLTPNASIEQQLQQANSSKPAHAAQLRLAAAEQALQQGKYSQAQSILAQVNPEHLPANQQMLAQVLRAETALAQQQAGPALSALTQPNMAQLSGAPTDLQARAHQARAQALALDGQTLAAARERVYLGTLLPSAQQAANHEHIWALVSALKAGQLTATGEQDLDGWLELARLSQQGNLSQQQSAINDWLTRHPEHPAALATPTALSQLLHTHIASVSSIALLLPQSGPLASVARALRDGFISAQMHDTNTDAPTVKLYDSSQISSLDAFYQQAQQDGINLVVGPLEKPLVKQLADRAQLPITTLALNYSEAQQNVPAQLYQFGLAAEDEAREAARRARADGFERAVALVPKGEWGERVLRAFDDEFQRLGGTLLDHRLIDQPVQLAQQIADLFKLRATAQSSQSLSSTRDQTPERRDDVEFLFLAATPQQAQQVKPTLVFQYVGDVPVYATSHIFAGNLTAAQLQDLDGIRFCETPWLLNSDSELQQRFIQQWPQASGSLGRLYAMGIDAFALSTQLQQLSFGDFAIDGYTGTLRLGDQQRIERQLPWAEIRHGQILNLAEPVQIAP